MARHRIRRGQIDEPAEPQSPVPERNRLTRHTLLLAIAGVFLTTAMIQALKGSYFPTSLFILAGLLAPIPVAHLLVRLTRSRLPFPGLTSVLAVVVVLTLIAIAGKFPNRSALFSEAFGVSPDQSVTLGSATRGWYDGRISVLHFRAPADAIRDMIPAGAEISTATDGLQQDEKVAAEFHDATWHRGIGSGWLVDRTLLNAPQWKSLHAARWRSDSPRRLDFSLTWDAETGEAVLVMSDTLET